MDVLLKKRHKYNLSNSYTLTCDTTRLVQDRDSFARIRPLPLTDWEDSLYLSFDERRRKEQGDTLQRAETKFKKNLVYIGQLGDALISSYDIDISKVGNITCSPLINPLLVSYSHRNGIRIVRSLNIINFSTMGDYCTSYLRSVIILRRKSFMLKWMQNMFTTL